MTVIWHNSDTGWRLLAPSGFPAEAALHDLVAEAPQMLPLSGAPHTAVVGREVLLGGNYADLIAIEPSGRLVVIEIKLARNAEARRAVVAQILTYAAFLKGMDPDLLETEILGKHLRDRQFGGLADAINAIDQSDSFDDDAFRRGLLQSLADGHFRLVLVLDDAPPELVRLVGYLESVTDGLIIDLVTVGSYDVAGSTVIVPQRIDAEQPRRQPASDPAPLTTSSKTQGRFVEGVEDFVESIQQAPSEHRESLQRLSNWAISLEREGLAKLGTFHGTAGRWTLLPRIPVENVGLVTIWNDHGAYVTLWRSVFERRAPITLPRIEEKIAPIKLGQGNSVRIPDSNDALLGLLTDAYREAAGKLAP